MWMAYGFATLLVLIAVWASGEHVLQKLGLLLLVSWASSNVAQAVLGFDGAPYVTPAIDAVLATVVAMLGIKNRSYIALAVVVIFFIQAGVHIVGFATNGNTSYAYYLSLNLLFLGQLAVVGGAGVARAMGRIARGPERVFSRRAGT